jgi:shikimate dehydrogenase
MRCAVLGSPIEHSLSPALHRAAYQELGLDWSYDAIEVDSAGLATFVDGLDENWRGLSLTMPLKRSVLPLLTERDDWVARSGAANTVILEGDRRSGFNTDIPGARAALEERDVQVQQVTILGGGATAGSVGLAVVEMGARDIRIAVRNPSTAEETRSLIGSHPAGPRVELVSLEQEVEAELLVSTIPAAAEENLRVGQVAAVFEVVYDPWPTPLAALANERGWTLIDGLDLLSHQAVGQVRLMIGQDVEVDVLRDAGRRALEAR